MDEDILMILYIRIQVKPEEIARFFKLFVYGGGYGNSFVRNRMIESELIGMKWHPGHVKSLQQQFVLLVATVFAAT